MPDETLHLEQIERYFMGGMPPGEQQEVEADQSFRLALEGYRPLFEGFQAARILLFRETINSWEADWQNAEETEAIEGFLAGNPAFQHLAQSIEADPALSEKTDRQRQILEGFAAARTDAFQSALKSWEKGDARQREPIVRRLWPRLAAAAAVALVILASGAFWYAGSHYSNEALVADYYHQPSIGNRMSADSPTKDEFIALFNDAHQLLYEKHYTEAIPAFEKLTALASSVEMDDLSRTYFMQNAAWSKLLAQLGAGQTGPEFEAALAAIAADSTHEYHRQALDLQRRLNTLWRRLGE